MTMTSWPFWSALIVIMALAAQRTWLGIKADRTENSDNEKGFQNK